MKVPLKKLASVQVGYTFRSRLEAAEHGRLAVIQMKDLGDDNSVHCGGLAHIDLDAIKDHHLARKGDLIFRSRGLVATAAILRDDPGPAIVSAPLLRIRVIQEELVLPEYLNWYIGQRDAQIYLSSRSMGTAAKMISKQAIEELEISLPHLALQTQIVALATLAAKEKDLLQQLADKKKQYISAVLMQFAREERK